MNDENWSRVYAFGRDASRISGVLKVAAAAFFGGAALVVGACLYFFIDNGLPGALIFWTAGLVAAAGYGWSGYRDLTGDPYVIRGRVVSKEIVKRSGSTGQSRTVRHYLHMEVSEAFAIASGGATRPMTRLTGRQKITAQGRLYEGVSEGEEVSVVCAATGVAARRLEEIR